MPTYEYEHSAKACSLGKVFELEHPITQDALKKCPQCGRAVKRLVSGALISITRSNSELKGMGFTKLVRRDKGVYENVTASGKKDKIMDVSGDD